ncbi:ribonuclease H-like domain-containing protein [Mycena olivaceomarginata]|nr:ribonuclease H-like domain-containing protein [Mycena olivaceomarginata]
MSKSPLSLVSRCRPSPPSPPRRAPMSTANVPKASESRILAALAGMSLTDTAVETSEPRPVHPFFRPTTTPAAKPRATAPPLKSATSLPAPVKKSSLTRVSPPKAPATPTAAELAAAELPVYDYKTINPAPQMRFTRNEADANKWVAELDQKGPLSVDFEWVVVYRKGGVRPISLVQVADARSILVIQLRTSNSSMARFPLELQRLLENPTVLKSGANILADAKKLFKDYGVMMAGLVELGALARRADPASTDAKVWGNGKRIVALAKLVERYLHQRLRKDNDVRVSNWEDPALQRNEAQLEYAANDAYCGLQVYNQLIALAKANDITLDPTSTATRVHHASLVPPPLASEASSHETLPPVPSMLLTPAMESAGVAPQHLRAYRHWALGHRDIDTMCVELAIRPEAGALARGTVVTYVVSAIKHWPSLAYDLGKLRVLIQTDLKSWERHFEWVANVAPEDFK